MVAAHQNNSPLKQNNSYHPLTFSILINVSSNLKFSVLDKCEILLKEKRYRNSTAPAAQKNCTIKESLVLTLHKAAKVTNNPQKKKKKKTKPNSSQTTTLQLQQITLLIIEFFTVMRNLTLNLMLLLKNVWCFSVTRCGTLHQSTLKLLFFQRCYSIEAPNPSHNQSPPSNSKL